MIGKPSSSLPWPGQAIMVDDNDVIRSLSSLANLSLSTCEGKFAFTLTLETIKDAVDSQSSFARYLQEVLRHTDDIGFGDIIVGKYSFNLQLVGI